MALLTLCTIVHFYTTGHLTATTALKALDAEFEAVSASLKVPFYKTFWRVTLPICTPALVDIARYFFINAMTTGIGDSPVPLNLIFCFRAKNKLKIGGAEKDAVKLGYIQKGA